MNCSLVFFSFRPSCFFCQPAKTKKENENVLAFVHRIVIAAVLSNPPLKVVERNRKMKVSVALLLSIVGLIGVHAEKVRTLLEETKLQSTNQQTKLTRTIKTQDEEQIQQEVSARMSGRKLFDGTVDSLSPNQFRPACGGCKFKGDLDDYDAIGFDADDYAESTEGN